MKIITGSFVLPNGTPAANDEVTFLLSQDASCSLGQLIHASVVATLDSNGALPSGFQLECNDELYTAGTWYTVSLKDPVYGQVYFERLVIAGTSPINLNLIAPSTR